MRSVGVGFLVLGLALQTQLVMLGQDGMQAMEEFVFYADTDVANPIADIDVEATFRNNSDTEVTVSGFWDGDSTFRVRFAPSSLGNWTYLTKSNVAELDGHSGSFESSPDTVRNAFSEKGWLKVSGTKFFEYADGDAAFLLIDAALEMPGFADTSEVARYIADRKSKGFNAVWLVPMSHQYIYPYGIRNAEGEEYYVNESPSLLNPRYFRLLDDMINRLNRAGMIAFVVPLWARSSALHTDLANHARPISAEDGLIHAKYIGARYAGNNVVWVTGGDGAYERPDQREYWEEFGELLRQVSGPQHLGLLRSRPRLPRPCR